MEQHHRHVPAQEDRGLGLSATPPDASGDDLVAGRLDDAGLEAGRALFAATWGFTRSCPTMADLPDVGAIEVAFAGRSNVGKSSLINALVGQRKLAHASNTPGRTRQLNMFVREDGTGPTLVDMPGYGYAKAPKDEVAAWTKLVFDYLRGRPTLRRVYLLVDARHGPKPVDIEAMKVMDDAAVSYQVVLTKLDKISAKEAAAVLAATETALRRRPAAHPVVLTTSSETGAGMGDLRAAIAASAV